MNKKIYLGTRASALDGHDLWFSEYYFNALFKMDLNDGQVEYIDTFPGRDVSDSELHISAFVCNENIVFTPYVGNIIHVYNKETKFIKSVPIIDGGSGSFCQGVKYGDIITFVSDKGMVVSFCISTFEIYIDKELTNEINLFIQKYGMINSFFVDNNTISIQIDTHVLRIYVQEHRVAYIELENENEDIEVLLYVDDDITMYSTKESMNIKRQNLKDDVVDDYYSGKINWGKNFKCNAFTKIVRLKNNEIIINYNSEQPLVRKKDGSILPIKQNDLQNNVVNKAVWGPIYQDTFIYGNKLYIVPCSGKYLLIFDDDDASVKTIPFFVDRNEIKTLNDMLYDHINNNGILKEGGSIFGLEEFIGFITKTGG